MTKARRARTPVALAAVALLTLSVLGYVHCARVHTPRIAGRVVDGRTGQPVEGADVMVYQRVNQVVSHSRVHFDYRWTTTGPDGSFSFEPSTVWKPDGTLWWRLDDDPSLRIIHPQYGSPAIFLPEDREKWGDFKLAIEPSQRTLEALYDPTWSGMICGGLMGKGYVHCCEAAYGSLERCDPSAPDLK